MGLTTLYSPCSKAISTRAARLAFAMGIAVLALSTSLAAKEKITDQQRVYLVREMTAEHGTAKLVIPRSKKPLALRPTGGHDEDQWLDAIDEYGPAARIGGPVVVVTGTGVEVPIGEQVAACHTSARENCC